MQKRFNLYHLFTEDQKKNLMQKEVRDRILEIINLIFAKKRTKPSLPATKEEQEQITERATW